MYVKGSWSVCLTLILVLASCSKREGGTSSQPTQTGVNNAGVQQFTEVPAQDGELALGIAFPSFVSFDEITDGLHGASTSVIGAKYFYFGGRGTIIPSPNERSIVNVANQIKTTLTGMANGMDQRNITFLKASGSKITEAAVQSDPMLQGIVKEGLLSIQRIDTFKKLNNSSKIIYSITLKADRDTFLTIQSKFKNIVFFKSLDYISPPEFDFVEQAYKSFTAKYYDNSVKTQSMNHADYTKFKLTAKERYNVTIGGEK